MGIAVKMRVSIAFRLFGQEGGSERARENVRMKERKRETEAPVDKAGLVDQIRDSMMSTIHTHTHEWLLCCELGRRNTSWAKGFRLIE